MIRISFFFAFSLIFIGCGTRIKSSYKTPIRERTNSIEDIIPIYPIDLDFKRNGRCIKTSRHNGSDSGPIKHQTLGNYTISNDSIIVTYIWNRSCLSRYDIEERDWNDIDHYETIYRINKTQDTLEVIKTKGQPGAKFILSDK